MSIPRSSRALRQSRRRPSLAAASARALDRACCRFAGVGLAWIVPALWNRTFLYAMLLWDGLLLLAFPRGLVLASAPESNSRFTANGEVRFRSRPLRGR